MLLLPSFFSHLTMFPSSMVGERAGICTLTELTPTGEKENKYSKESFGLDSCGSQSRSLSSFSVKL